MHYTTSTKQAIQKFSTSVINKIGDAMQPY